MPLVVPLIDLAAFVVALGLCIICIYFVRALFGTVGSAVGWIPWLGGKTKGELKRIEAKLTGELSKVVAGLDAGISWSWYQIAHVSEWMANEIKRNAATVFALSGYVRDPLSIPAWGRLWRYINGRVEALPHLAGGIARDLLRPIEGELRVIERRVFPRIGRLEKALDHTIPKDVAGLRARTKTLEGDYTKLYKMIRAQVGKWDITLFAGAVAIALARLGGSWIRCNNWKRIGREVCATDGLAIEGVLGLLATGAVIADFRELVKLAQSVEHATATVLQDVAKI